MGAGLTDITYFFAAFLLLLFFCANALPAADLEALLVLPSVSTDDAAVAALAEVVLLAVLCCASALPAAVLDFAAVLVD